jgi:ABC-2 type transport system ATP-binding protein
MGALIEVRDLHKRYKGANRDAVDGISFDVTRGNLFALLGPNGAGKTTTISILTTTLLPSTGRVTIAGFDVVTQPSAVRQNVGIIFQKPSLDRQLTAEENIRFHALLYGIYPFRPSYRSMPASYRRQVEEMAAVLGIENELHHRVKTFSGGMMRKLEIVRSLVHRPKVLFLDEPTLGLDPSSRRTLWEYIRDVRREHGTTIFLTTHYLEEAEDADAIGIINGGAIVSMGTPAQIKADLVREYLVVDADDREALRRELTRLNLEVSCTGPFRVGLGHRTAYELVRAIDVPLTVLRTHFPTLEDAYLQIVGRDE